jgi:Icc-related predicted phosphoesterase
MFQTSRFMDARGYGKASVQAIVPLVVCAAPDASLVFGASPRSRTPFRTDPLSQWFFTSDLHGQGSLYEQLLAIAAAHRPRVILVGGDLAPHATGEEGLRRQRLFLQGFLVEFARRLREASADTELMMLMGNDDWGSNHDCLEEQHGRLWHSLHGRVTSVDGRKVAGLSWVPITPFGIKDWERWEDGSDESPARLDGWVSRDGRIESFRFDPERRAPTIAEALAELAAAAPPAETVFVLHSPPRGTNCDLTAARVHVGSRAIRAFLERHQPPLALSGHIHESARVSGSYRDAIGDTLTVNPGQFGHSRLCGVWFDPEHPHESVRHTVHG